MPAESAPPSGDGQEPEPVRLKVTGDLDLHTFRPRDLPELLPAWFGECRAQGIMTIRVIHGKGTGTLRTGVHRLLEKMAPSAQQVPLTADSVPDARGLVKSWTFPAPDTAGGWGATLVYLQ